MTEAEEFRQYAKEAMLGSLESKDESEKRDLLELATTWSQAALLSDGVFGSSFTPSPRDADEAKAPTRS
jgi:hypothetical protein